MSRILSDHAEIRQWAEARAGLPMMMDNPGGEALLQITFGQHALNSENNEGADRPVPGYGLVSWDDWLAELENKGLAIKVNDDQPGLLDNDFEFVTPENERITSGAAQQPAPGTVEQPGEDETPDRGR